MRRRNPVVVQGRAGRGGVGRAGRALWVAAELFVTCGVVLVLFVVQQLWWTNEQARAQAGRQVSALEREWGERDDRPDAPSGTGAGTGADAPSGVRAGARPGGRPDAQTEPDTQTAASPAYAVLRIPRIGLTAPVAEGVAKRGVLDRGYVGHYPGTAAPGRAGNFALAGHRNTHGEPFRYVNRLRKGDTIEVRTRQGTFTYRVDLVLPQTSPRDRGVIAPVPRSLYKPSYGYDEPGAYLTLTTCTPEYTSTYRLIVWAKLVTP
ncbi:class E sortase [Streptomyces sp. NPDC048659]|uniref:class E sortase n=1 Tax=Streptomyces sp. NPDC048659 TaxID=3155489 RepID=UPI00342E46B1